jgi:hypothetical protein
MNHRYDTIKYKATWKAGWLALLDTPTNDRTMASHILVRCALFITTAWEA